MKKSGAVKKQEDDGEESLAVEKKERWSCKILSGGMQFA